MIIIECNCVESYMAIPTSILLKVLIYFNMKMWDPQKISQSKSHAYIINQSGSLLTEDSWLYLGFGNPLLKITTL